MAYDLYRMDQEYDPLIDKNLDFKLDGEDYRLWISEQINNVLSAVNGKSKIFIGLPAYAGKPSHNPEIENIYYGLLGILNSDYLEFSNFAGPSIYNYDEMKMTDWSTFDYLWLDQNDTSPRIGLCMNRADSGSAESCTNGPGTGTNSEQFSYDFGDTLRLYLSGTNTTSSVIDVDLYIALEYASEFIWYPSWNSAVEPIHVTLPYETMFNSLSLLEITLVIDTSIQTSTFYAALTQQGTGDLISIDSCEWSYVP